MDQDILTPEKTPASASQAFSPLGCFIAAFGAALLTFCLLTAASAASIWAFSHLLGLSEGIARILILIGLVPPVLASIWVAGRAWHVERRLAQHHDIDNPVFKLVHYLRRRPA